MSVATVAPVATVATARWAYKGGMARAALLAAHGIDVDVADVDVVALEGHTVPAEAGADDVEYVDNLEKALIERDVTINECLLLPDGSLIATDRARQDAADHIVRVVDPSGRAHVRGARFAAALGWGFAPHPRREDFDLHTLTIQVARAVERGDDPLAMLAVLGYEDPRATLDLISDWGNPELPKWAVSIITEHYDCGEWSTLAAYLWGRDVAGPWDHLDR